MYVVYPRDQAGKPRLRQCRRGDSPGVGDVLDAIREIHDDPVRRAEIAGLHYVRTGEPGIRRRRHGRGFAYRTDRGQPVRPAVTARIAELAIPPAWTDVWICADRVGHLQATGVDDRG